VGGAFTPADAIALIAFSELFSVFGLRVRIEDSLKLPPADALAIACEKAEVD